MRRTRSHRACLESHQEEQLALAIEWLVLWSPPDVNESTSLPELAVVFRSNLLRAKILRYQGDFVTALDRLHTCQEIVRRHHCKSIILDDDFATLASEPADVFCELGKPLEAEKALSMALAQPEYLTSPADHRLLSLCLAEALFAQERMTEAEEACCAYPLPSEKQKMARLRLCITRSKVRHLQSDWDGAMSWWTQALQAINKFPPTSCHATPVLHLSIADVLLQQGSQVVLDQTVALIRGLDGLVVRSETKFCIAGLRSWEKYLSEKVLSSYRDD